MELTGLDVFSHEVPDDRRRIIDEAVNVDLLEKNKYANNSEFIPDKVYRKVLNRISNYQWSFVPHSIEQKGSDKEPYIEFIGLLVVPGFGIHTGIGTQALNKKDNKNATAAAKTYAFKNACKEMGLAPNVGDDDWDTPILESDVQEEIAAKKKKIADKKKAEEKPAKKKKPADNEEDDLPGAIRKKIKTIRAAYEVKDDDEFVAFLQIWNEDIMDTADLTEKDWTKFFKYLDEHPDEFEEF